VHGRYISFGVLLFLDIIRAMATNRTLLWKYVDDNVCEQESDRGCHQRLLNDECDRFLGVHSWLPSYEEWADRLDLRDEFPVQVNTNADAREGVVTFPYHWPKLTDESIWFKEARISEEGETLTEMLFDQGLHFLYGLLFEESIKVKEIVRNASEIQPQSDPLAFTVALYSPSAPLFDQGGWNETEIVNAIECLETILLNVTSECQIFFVGDVPGSMSHFSGVGNCSVSSVTSKEDSTDSDDSALLNDIDSSTHQNYQFFQSFVYATRRARSAFLGPTESIKSALIQDRIDYLRRQEAWKLGRIPPLLSYFWTCPIEMQTNG